MKYLNCLFFSVVVLLAIMFSGCRGVSFEALDSKLPPVNAGELELVVKPPFATTTGRVYAKDLVNDGEYKTAAEYRASIDTVGGGTISFTAKDYKRKLTGPPAEKPDPEKPIPLPSPPLSPE